MDEMGIYYGNDHITMKKNKGYKKRQAKKHGFTVKHNDAEFRLDGIYNKEQIKKARRLQREKAAEEKAKDIDELFEIAMDKVAELVFEED